MAAASPPAANSRLASSTMLTIRLPPGVPSTATRSGVSRKVGVMLESGRLPGAMALATLPTRP